MTKYVRKTITIREDQSKRLRDSDVNLSKLVQRSLDKRFPIKYGSK